MKAGEGQCRAVKGSLRTSSSKRPIHAYAV
jgi:hypothetical protein